MWPDRVSNPGPLTYESGALPIALRGPTIFKELKRNGPDCSKLTMSLVNVSLHVQKLTSQICQYFLLKKCEKLLQCKSFSHFFNKKYQ